MGKITISLDTGDLGEQLCKKHDLEVTYFGVVIGDKVMRDTEVKPEDIYKAVEVDGLLPKTNAVLEMDYRELFERATADGGHIIHFNISDKLSASHSNARRAATGMERVHVIDSKTISLGIGALAMKASELVKAGKPVEEVVAASRKMVEQLNVGFIIKDLNYLYRGGRASGLKLLGANFLKIRPSLQLNEVGKIVPDKKFKGDFAHAVDEWTKYKIGQAETAHKDVAFVVHSDISEAIAEKVVADFREAGFADVRRFVTGPTLTTHVGRNMIGVLFLHK